MQTSKSLVFGGLVAALAGVACVAFMAISFDIEAANPYADIAYYLIAAVLFFAIAGGFASNGQWSFDVMILMNFVAMAFVIVAIILGGIELWYGVILVIAAIVAVATVVLTLDAPVRFKA